MTTHPPQRIDARELGRITGGVDMSDLLRQLPSLIGQVSSMFGPMSGYGYNGYGYDGSNYGYGNYGYGNYGRYAGYNGYNGYAYPGSYDGYARNYGAYPRYAGYGGDPRSFA